MGLVNILFIMFAFKGTFVFVNAKRGMMMSVESGVNLCIK